MNFIKYPEARCLTFLQLLKPGEMLLFKCLTFLLLFCNPNSSSNSANQPVSVQRTGFSFFMHSGKLSYLPQPRPVLFFLIVFFQFFQLLCRSFQPPISKLDISPVPSLYVQPLLVTPTWAAQHHFKPSSASFSFKLPHLSP